MHSCCTENSHIRWSFVAGRGGWGLVGTNLWQHDAMWRMYSIPVLAVVVASDLKPWEALLARIIRAIRASRDNFCRETSRCLAGPSGQEAAQFLPKGCSRKMSPSFLNLNGIVCSNTLFSNTSALTSSLLFRGDSIFYMQDSRTPRLVEHFWVPILGASCSNKLFVSTVRPSHLGNGTKSLRNARKCLTVQKLDV